MGHRARILKVLVVSKVLIASRPTRRRDLGKQLLVGWPFDPPVRDLRGTADIDYAPAGFTCRLIFLLDPWGKAKEEEEASSEPTDDPSDGA